MKVVILCGGEGARLRQETEFRPKPMVEIGGKPILWHIMKLYAHQGFCDFVLCLGYQAWKIKEYFLNYQAMNCDFTVRTGRDRAIDVHGVHGGEDWQVTLADTGEHSMTGARVRRIQRYLLPGEDFMLTYGDGLADINLADLLAFHRTHGKLVTLTAVHSVGRFGEVESDERNLVRTFVEKPRKHERSRIAGGFFVCKYEFLDHLSEEADCVLEREPMERLVREGQLAAYPHDGYWQCMDTHREWLTLNEQWNRSDVPWAVWRNPSPTTPDDEPIRSVSRDRVPCLPVRGRTQLEQGTDLPTAPFGAEKAVRKQRV